LVDFAGLSVRIHKTPVSIFCKAWAVGGQLRLFPVFIAFTITYVGSAYAERGMRDLDIREFFFFSKKYNTFVVETQVNEAKNIY
jgi:hypothetical protein